MKKHLLCETKDIADGQKKRFEAGAEKIMVANVGGEFFAIEDTCTHALASLTAGTLSGYEVECPRHGARFDVRTGEVSVLPAVIKLKTYPLCIEDGKVYLMKGTEEEMEECRDDEEKVGAGCCGNCNCS